MTNQDIIFIEALSTEAIIGIFDWEQAAPQPLIMDIEISTDLRKAANSDDITDTICYSQVSDDVDKMTRDSRFELIETLAEFICSSLLVQHPSISKIKLKLNKPEAVKKALATGLIIVRTQPDKA